jgi:spore coat polysaccharide biosynthesis protein SpsF
MSSLGIIIFSRFDSVRLPGKAMLELGGIPMLARIIRRAKLTGYPVYLATSVEQNDNILVDLAESENIGVFRGSKDDVLSRAINAAEYFKLNAFARLCGDRPMFSVDEIKYAFSMYDALDNIGYPPHLITNHLFNQQAPGLTTEIIDTSLLKEFSSEVTDSLDREHITRYIYSKKEHCSIVSLPLSNVKTTEYRWAVDTSDDFSSISYLFNQNAHVGLSIEEALAILSNHQKPL